MRIVGFKLVSFATADPLRKASPWLLSITLVPGSPTARTSQLLRLLRGTVRLGDNAFLATVAAILLVTHLCQCGRRILVGLSVPRSQNRSLDTSIPTNRHVRRVAKRDKLQVSMYRSCDASVIPSHGPCGALLQEILR